MELLLIGFIAPGLTSGAISSERERQTIDLLRISLLSARSLVFGKLGTACVFLFLLILATLPIESIGFLLGGVGIAEMIVSTLLLIVTAIAFCSLGLFFSSFMKRTLTATVSAYGTVLLSGILLVVIVLIGSYIASIVAMRDDGLSENTEKVLTVLIWLLISTNPLLTAVLTEIILVEEQSIWYTTNLPFDVSFRMPSPWIPYVLVYLLASFVLIRLSAHFAGKQDR
jgi:ABC-type transport system involved in multi-copper enzyme maturation permease subunit